MSSRSTGTSCKLSVVLPTFPAPALLLFLLLRLYPLEAYIIGILFFACSSLTAVLGWGKSTNFCTGITTGLRASHMKCLFLSTQLVHEELLLNHISGFGDLTSKTCFVSWICSPYMLLQLNVVTLLSNNTHVSAHVWYKKVRSLSVCFSSSSLMLITMKSYI